MLMTITTEEMRKIREEIVGKTEKKLNKQMEKPKKQWFEQVKDLNTRMGYVL